MNIFYKELGGKKVRSRNGSDMAELDGSMRKIRSVRDFIKSGSRWDNGSRGRTMATRGGVRLGRRRRKRAMTTKKKTPRGQ